MKQLLVVACVCVLGAVTLAMPAHAGLHYTAVTKTEGAQGRGQDLQVEAWVEGANAKITFTESNNPMMSKGSYLLTEDGGKTIYLVNPEEKTYAAFDIGALLGTMGTMMNAMGPMLKISVSNQKVEKLAEEPGPAMLGHATTHYRFHTAYDVAVKVMMMGSTSHVDTTTDTWTTSELTDLGLGAWLRTNPPRTGNADIDGMIAHEITKDIHGVPLKVVTLSKNQDSKRGESTTTTTMEVTTLEKQSVPADAFAMPKGYEQVDLMQSMAPHQQ